MDSLSIRDQGWWYPVTNVRKALPEAPGDGKTFGKAPETAWGEFPEPFHDPQDQGNLPPRARPVILAPGRERDQGVERLYGAIHQNI